MIGVMQTIQATYDRLEFSLEDLENLASELLKKYTIEEIEAMNEIQFNKAVNKAVKKVELKGVVN